MLVHRPRRNRQNEAIRSLVQESHLLASHLIPSLFVKEGSSEPVKSMPGVFRLSMDDLVKEAKRLNDRGIQAIILFPVIEEAKKDEKGSEALRPDGLFCRAISKLKEQCPDLCVIADLALDPYTAHGHDGVVDERGEVVNDETVEILAEMAAAVAKAGADMVAPSDMMDGRVGAIRKQLDSEGHACVSIMAYSAKYASAFYGPFRDALGSAPKMGDKRGYQMDPANGREAVREVWLDIYEGADIVMVKPALSYLDVIYRVRQQTQLPVAGFCVSGEYAMICAAGEKGWIDRDRALWEAHLSIRRAGADMILTYAADRLLDYSRSL